MQGSSITKKPNKVFIIVFTGFLSMLLLQLLLRKKAAEELKKEQERKAAERRRIIEERCGKAKPLDDANEGKTCLCKPTSLILPTTPTSLYYT